MAADPDIPPAVQILAILGDADGRPRWSGRELSLAVYGEDRAKTSARNYTDSHLRTMMDLGLVKRHRGPVRHGNTAPHFVYTVTQRGNNLLADIVVCYHDHQKTDPDVPAPGPAGDAAPPGPPELTTV